MALTKAQLVDMNANELILDLDADTSITSDTDDTIDIKIGGADDFKFTANTFTALAGSTITGPTIVGTTSVQTPLIEFTDGDDAMTIADGGVVTFAQAPVFPDGSLAVVDLDIDGATDIGAAIVDADLFIIDDGAGGTNRKVAASRLKTYAAGGEWTKLSHVTASNDATVVFNSSLITSTYQDYKVVYSNIHAASDRQIFNLRLSVDNGTNITNVDFVHRSFKPDGNVASLGETDNANFRLHGNETSGNAAGESLSGFIEIFDPSATDTRKHILGRTVFNLGDSGVVHFHSLLGGSTRVTNAVNYLRFNWASGNIASGEFTLYGRKI